MSVASVHGGAHCAEAGCHQLDFLPFTCDKCRRVFCLDHRDPSHHACSFDITQQNVMPQCPVCQQRVFVSADDSADARVNAHILSGCTAHLMKDVQAVVRQKQSAALRCDFVDGCSNKQAYSTVQCKRCRRQFCLSHRFPENHKCSALTAASPPPSSDKHAKGKALLERVRREREEKDAQKAAAAAPAAPVVKRPAPPQRRAQSTTLQQIRAQMSSVGSYIAESLTGSSDPAPPAPAAASKASSSSPPPPPPAAMREQAVGDERIPVEERWYLSVDASALRPHRPRKPGPLPCAFVSRQWTVGRCIDALCEAVGVDNENHLDGRPKIGLGCERTLKGGVLLPNDLALHLLSPAVMNGDTVQLRYREAASPAPASVPGAS